MMGWPYQPAMILGYARVSTEEQAEALAAQVSRLEAHGCNHVIQERQSGGRNDREGLLEAIATVRAGRVRQLVVTRLDRLGRDAAYADQLLALCSLQGVEVVALDGGTVEIASPTGFMAARLQTTMAEFERRMLSQRIKRNFEVYRQQGRHLRRRIPFGYDGTADHKLTPHPENWSFGLRVLDELREYGNFTRVAQRLPEWCPWTPSSGNLRGWFCNPVIRGHLAWGGNGLKGWRQSWREIRYNQHEAMIGEVEWRELAILLQRTVNRFGINGPSEAKHGLSGLLKCAGCGHRMSRNSSGGVAWWRCRHRLCRERGGVKEVEALAVVVAECVKAAETLARLAAMPAATDPAVAVRLQDLDALRLLAARNPSLEAAVAAEEEAIEAMVQRPRVVPDLEAYQGMLRDPLFFEGATAAEQRALFAGVLQEVRVARGGGCVAVPRSW